MILPINTKIIGHQYGKYVEMELTNLQLTYNQTILLKIRYK
jgi:hypothetical protein